MSRDLSYNIFTIYDIYYMLEISFFTGLFMAKQKKQIEYRYYEIPSGHYVLALLGKGWEQSYSPEIEGLLHFHNYLEIGICYWGDGDVIINDDKIHYTGSEFTIIPKNIPHVTVSRNGGTCKWEYLFIDIDSYIMKEMKMKRLLQEDVVRSINSRAYMMTWKENPYVTSLIKSIIREYREEKPHYKDCVEGYLRSLVIELVRINEQHDEVEMKVANRQNSYIESAVKYIADHFDEDIKMEDVAAVCGLSESHFRRIFEETMSMKPLDYVNMVRINKACEMIASKELAMEEIGIRVGYQIPSTFNRNFKKLTGKTPYQWKKEAHTDGALVNYKISAKKGWEVKSDGEL